MRPARTVLTCFVVMLLLSAPAAATAEPPGGSSHRFPAHPKSPAHLQSPPGLVVTESTRSFEETWDTLIEALKANANIGIVAEIDHAAAAANVGLRLPPTRLVIFGNPALGTPLMQADQRVGLDLPQKMLVYQRHGRVFVAYNSAAYLAARHHVGGVETLDTIAGALRGLAGAATGATVNDAPRLGFVRFFDGLETHRSRFGVEETVARLQEAIDQSPANVVVTVDHAANAATAGLDLRPTTLVVFGNPQAGTPLMQASRTTAIDLPLKILVWEDASGRTLVTTNRVLYLALRHRIFGERDTLRAIDQALDGLIATATGR